MIRHIYRWDLDKTYLRTEFETIRGLIRTALQSPEQRVNVPGVVRLLKELSRPNDDGDVYITFISGSPTQMREKLERKFALDGIEPDVFVLKPTLKNLLKGRFRAIRGQIGYKLDSLLRLREQGPRAPETMFGDDAEQDAFIYSLYADLAGERVGRDLLFEILEEAGVYSRTRASILERFSRMPVGDDVGRIFIHLDYNTAPGQFWVYGPRVVPITNYFQASLVLFSDGVLQLTPVLRVASGMIAGGEYGVTELANSFQDLIRRRHLDRSAIDRFGEGMQRFQQAPDQSGVRLPEEFFERLLARVRALAPRTTAPVRSWKGPPDYLAVLKADQKLRKNIDGDPGLFGP